MSDEKPKSHVWVLLVCGYGEDTFSVDSAYASEEAANKAMDEATRTAPDHVSAYVQEVDLHRNPSPAPNFPLPWSYDCRKGMSATVYDAESTFICFIKGADAEDRAIAIVNSVNHEN